jgi:hypothetical protein
VIDGESLKHPAPPRGEFQNYAPVVRSKLIAHDQTGLGTSIAQLYNRVVTQAKTLGRVSNRRRRFS